MNEMLLLAALSLMPRHPYNRICDPVKVEQAVEQAREDDRAGREWSAPGAIAYAYRACERRQ